MLAKSHLGLDCPSGFLKLGMTRLTKLCCSSTQPHIVRPDIPHFLKEAFQLSNSLAAVTKSMEPMQMYWLILEEYQSSILVNRGTMIVHHPKKARAEIGFAELLTWFHGSQAHHQIILFV